MKRISISFLSLLAAFLCPFFQLDAMQAASSSGAVPMVNFVHCWQTNAFQVTDLALTEDNRYLLVENNGFSRVWYDLVTKKQTCLESLKSFRP